MPFVPPPPPPAYEPDPRTLAHWRFLRHWVTQGYYADDRASTRAQEQQEHDTMSTPDPPAPTPPTPPAPAPAADPAANQGVNDQAADLFADDWQGMRDGLADAFNALTDHLRLHHGATPSEPPAAPAEPPATPSEPPAPKLPKPHWWWREFGKRG